MPNAKTCDQCVHKVARKTPAVHKDGEKYTYHYIEDMTYVSCGWLTTNAHKLPIVATQYQEHLRQNIIQRHTTHSCPTWEGANGTPSQS